VIAANASSIPGFVTTAGFAFEIEDSERSGHRLLSKVVVKFITEAGK